LINEWVYRKGSLQVLPLTGHQ